MIVATAFPTVRMVVRAAPLFPVASMSIEPLPVALLCFAVNHESAMETVHLHVLVVVNCKVAFANDPLVPSVTDDGLKLYEHAVGLGVGAGEPPPAGATPTPITAMMFVPLV